MRCAIYCSVEAHQSVVRAAELLGIGSDGVHQLPIDGHRRMVVAAAAQAIDADRAAGIVPVALVASLGTTLTGAVDPIGALADVCAERDVWLHADGAYGLPAAAAPSAAHLFYGLERADSVAVDAHKWLYLPKACSAVLVREPRWLRGAFAHDESYMPHVEEEPHAVDTTLEYSRPFRALKLWLAFRAHGADALRDAIERNLAQARLLAAEIRRTTTSSSSCPSRSSRSCRFATSRPASPISTCTTRAWRARCRRTAASSWPRPRSTAARALRPCIVNFRTDDDDVRALVQVAREVGAALV